MTATATQCNTSGEHCGSRIALINHVIDAHWDETYTD